MTAPTPSLSLLTTLPRDQQEFWAEVVELAAQAKQLASRSNVAVYEHPPIKCIHSECSPTDREAFSVSYTFTRVYFDWPDEPPEKDKYVMVRVIFNDEFSEAERNVLVQSFRKFINVILTPAYNNRVLNASGFTFPRRPELEVPWGGTFPTDWSEYHKQWRLFVYMLNYLPPHRPDYGGGRPRYCPIYVERFNENSDTWGRAEINHFTLSQVFRISLNAHIINNVSSDSDRWAGVIAHEMMHNLGWEHGSDTINRDEFIYVVQNAVRDL